MLKPRHFLILVATTTICATSSAQSAMSGDICALRPDLCDGKPRRPAQRQPNKPSRSPASASAAQAQGGTAVGRREFAQRLSERRPTAVPMSFEEYMTDNSNHPAMHARIPDHQSAFMDNSKAATFGDTAAQQKELDGAINAANANNAAPAPPAGANPAGFGAPTNNGWPAQAPANNGWGTPAPATYAPATQQQMPLPAPVAAPAATPGASGGTDSGGPIR